MRPHATTRSLPSTPSPIQSFSPHICTVFLTPPHLCSHITVTPALSTPLPLLCLQNAMCRQPNYSPSATPCTRLQPAGKKRRSPALLSGSGSSPRCVSRDFGIYGDCTIRGVCFVAGFSVCYSSFVDTGNQLNARLMQLLQLIQFS